MNRATAAFKLERLHEPCASTFLQLPYQLWKRYMRAKLTSIQVMAYSHVPTRTLGNEGALPSPCKPNDCSNDVIWPVYN